MSSTYGYASNHFAIASQATTAAFVEVAFGFVAGYSRIENIGGQPAELSFDGSTVHRVLAAAAVVEYPRKIAEKIWVRHSGTTTDLRIEAW